MVTEFVDRASVVVPTINGTCRQCAPCPSLHFRSAAAGLFAVTSASPPALRGRPLCCRPSAPAFRCRPARRLLPRRRTSVTNPPVAGHLAAGSSAAGPPVIGRLAVGPPLWPSEATGPHADRVAPPVLRAPCFQPYRRRFPAAGFPSPAFLSPALAAAVAAARPPPSPPPR